MRILSTAKYIHSNHTFGNQGNSHQVGKKSQWTHSETDRPEDSIYYLTPICPSSNRSAWWCFGPLGIPINLDPVSNIPQISDYPSFPSLWLSKETTINQFGEGLKKICIHLPWRSRFFLIDTQSLLWSMHSRFENRLWSLNQASYYDFLLEWCWPQSSTINLFLLCIKQYPFWLSIYLVPRNTCSTRHCHRSGQSPWLPLNLTIHYGNKFTIASHICLCYSRILSSPLLLEEPVLWQHEPWSAEDKLHWAAQWGWRPFQTFAIILDSHPGPPEKQSAERFLVLFGWCILACLLLGAFWFLHPHSVMTVLTSLLFFFFFLAALCGMQDLTSPTRDQTWAPCSGSTES